MIVGGTHYWLGLGLGCKPYSISPEFSKSGRLNLRARSPSCAHSGRLGLYHEGLESASIGLSQAIKTPHSGGGFILNYCLKLSCFSSLTGSNQSDQSRAE